MKQGASHLAAQSNAPNVPGGSAKQGAIHLDAQSKAPTSLGVAQSSCVKTERASRRPWVYTNAEGAFRIYMKAERASCSLLLPCPNNNDNPLDLNYDYFPLLEPPSSSGAEASGFPGRLRKARQRP